MSPSLVKAVPMCNKKWTALMLFLSVLYLAPAVSGKNLQDYSAESDKARDAAERLLDLSGGRENWNSVRSVRLIAVNRSPSIQLPYIFEVGFDFAEPRSFVRILSQDMDRFRVYLGGSGWGMKEGDTGPTDYDFTEDRLVQENMLWEGSFSRNLWRVASRDTTLLVRLSDDNRLIFANKTGGPTAWMRLDEAGFPFEFGFADSPQGLELGKYGPYGPRRIPRDGKTPEGVAFETLAVFVSSSPLRIPNRTQIRQSGNGLPLIP